MVIDDFFFEVLVGEVFGVIGGNGFGKLMLFKFVVGFFQLILGQLSVDGCVVVFIEFGVGFYLEIFGCENVFINGFIFGFGCSEIEWCYDEIIEFLGFGDFIEELVKNYLSGMYVCFGFVVVIYIDFEVFFVDEVLVVGDEQFVYWCLVKIEEYFGCGCILMVVSYSFDFVESFCDWVLWFEKGYNQGVGELCCMIDVYCEQVVVEEGCVYQVEKVCEEVFEDCWGLGQVCIDLVCFFVGGQECYDLVLGDVVVFEISVCCDEFFDDFVFGVVVLMLRGVECWGMNIDFVGFELECWQGLVIVRLCCLELWFVLGEYLVDVVVYLCLGVFYDYCKGVY